MNSPNAKRPRLLVIAALCAVFALFVWWYEHAALASLEQQTYLYGQYLETPLWKLDTEVATQYLRLISQAGLYRSIDILHADGGHFVGTREAYVPGLFDPLLSSVHLIRDRAIDQPIYHRDQSIGYIRAVWVNDTIYIHIAMALVLALIGKALLFYIHLTANRRTLERNNLELRENEKKVQESEDYLQRITESLGEGLLITDMDDRVLYVNLRMATMTGYAQEEMLGKLAYELFLPPEQHSDMVERNQQRYRGVVDQYEIQMQCRDGSPFWARIHATPFRNNAGEIIATLGSINDITEHKQLEDQLQHSQKMDAIGQLTAGAHNFNNMLMGIMGNIEFATVPTISSPTSKKATASACRQPTWSTSSWPIPTGAFTARTRG